MLENKTDIISYTESAISSSNLSTIKSKNLAIIIFKVKYETIKGQEVFILGNTKELGFWQPGKGLKMSTDEASYPFWRTTEELKLSIGTEISYKYLIMNSFTKEIQWESNMSNRSLKIENKGKYEIKEEKGNKKREIVNIKNNKSNITFSNLNPKTIGTISPIHDRNLFQMKDLTDNDIEIRGSMCSSDNDENNILINAYFSEVLNYDPIRIDSMQKNPLTIALKTQIEINPKEDKFIILTALLPFNIEINNNDNNSKYKIVPKYEDEFYESLFNIRKENLYEIHWFGMLENYEKFLINKNGEEPSIDPDLTEFLKKERIYVINPKLNDYNNYWIYISHIIGKIFYDNKIPVNDTYFMDYEKYFNSYKIINELFVEEIINQTNLDMLIMIHDINLALVPHFISKKNSFAKMGFYFNDIFPCLEVFKCLQYQEEILQSILLCNLICFHHIETTMKFLNTVQRILDLYYEVKPGGKIIINYQGRNVNIHIMQIGIDTKKIEDCFKNKDFIECCDKIKKKYKEVKINKDNVSENNKINDNKNEKEKYIFFSLDGLLDINKIIIKLQAFDVFYDSYIKELEKINSENMEKIIEVNEENANGVENNNNYINEIKTTTNEQNDTLITITSNSKNEDKQNVINTNATENKKQNLQNDNINNKSIEQINKNILKKFTNNKPKIKKGKSKSGINLSQTPPDSQSQVLKKQKKEIYKTKEPLFIQIIKPSESKLMNLYNYSSYESERIKEQIEKNFKKIETITQEINNKHKKEIIVLIGENNYKNLFSIYSIGDCYYSLRKDYNFSINIQYYIYICNYLNKSYDLIISENSCLTPGIKGALKVNDLDIIKNYKSLEHIFSSNNNDDKLINKNNINFIKNAEILNFCKIFFSKLKKVSFYENDSLKKIYGIGLGFSLMRLSHDFLLLDKKKLNEAYHESNQNLIIIDYVSILQSFSENNIYQKENIMYQLKLLSSQEKNKVYVISSNTKIEFEQNFKDIPDLGLACEYGFFYKPPREGDYHQLKYIEDWTWKQGIMPILNGFTERTEGSYIIEKESMITWVYKNCEADFGQFQANEMISHIKSLLFQNDFIVVEDDVEKNEVNIRPKNINKGSFIAEILKQDYINGEFPDLVIGIGDKDGGEDMFKYLNYLKNNFSEIKAKIFTIVVNKRISSANYYLNDASEIIEVVENFNKIDKSEDNFSSSQDMYNIMEQSDDFELKNINDDTLI